METPDNKVQYSMEQVNSKKTKKTANHSKNPKKQKVIFQDASLNRFSLLDEESDEEIAFPQVQEMKTPETDLLGPAPLDVPVLTRTTNSHEVKKKWKMGFAWADEMEDC
jgi:hypothetical protein